MPIKPPLRAFSGIPAGLERPVNKATRVSLVEIADVLIEQLTPALCQAVFKRVRKTERERKWTLTAIAHFWTAMAVHHPPSLGSGLNETRKRNREELWPRVMAEPQAFFEKCAGLRADFFHALFNGFNDRLRKSARPTYASWLEDVRENFPKVQVIDGSKLDAVARRLKLLWPVRFSVLPGCMTVVYDLFTGMAEQAHFEGDAASNERARAPEIIGQLHAGTLLLGDRMYCLVQTFHQLNSLGAYGIFRLSAILKVKRIAVLNSFQDGRRFCEDVLVEVGCGATQPKVRLRLIRYREGRYSLDLLTNVVQVEKLPAQTAVRLYGMRWTIERMFLSLKKTLRLHCLYGSHPNLVAQQFYATMMVYNVFRVAQAEIASEHNLLPEQLSPERLFPKLAEATRNYALARWQEIRIRELNPGVPIKFPDLRKMPKGNTSLGSILAEHRARTRKPPKKMLYPRVRSLTKVPGGTRLLATVSDG